MWHYAYQNIPYTYLINGERNTMTLPGGGTWTYQYGIPTLSVTGSYENAYYLLPKNDADSLSKNLVAIIDDQGRKIEFRMDMFGHLQSEFSNETYTTGGSPRPTIIWSAAPGSRINYGKTTTLMIMPVSG